MAIFKVSRYIFIVVILSACSSTPSLTLSVSPEPQLYFDEYFTTYDLVAIETEKEVFSIDEEMKMMVKNKLLIESDPIERAKKLLNHLFAQEYVNLAYESDANLTATQTYHSSTANCMSLTIMAYVLAKEAGLDVEFQDIDVPEYWVRNGQYNMVTGHVNLLVKKPIDDNVAIYWGVKTLQIDFDPYILKKSFPKTVVDKATILAMFYTNKGAQAMVNGQYTTAYAYLKKATEVAPLFSSSWSNLGILYRLVENYSLARKTYQYTLTLDPNNLTVLSNFAMLMKKEGLTNEAYLLEKKLHNKRAKNPYYHALLADEALYKGELNIAKQYYKSAIKLNNKVHEFYYGLAKVYYQLDEYPKARIALNKAITLNKARTTEQQYVAKLQWINASNNAH